jgi:hypothetical protein
MGHCSRDDSTASYIPDKLQQQTEGKAFSCLSFEFQFVVHLPEICCILNILMQENWGP